MARLDPQDERGFSESVRYGQAESLRHLDRPDEAVACFRQMPSQYPNSELSADAHLEIGYTDQQTGRAQQAVAADQELLGLSPDHPDVDWVKR